MASFESFLQVAGKQYTIRYTDFELHQHVDSLGRPASPTLGGTFVIDLDAPPAGDATLHEWMIDPVRFLNGQVLIKNLDTNTVSMACLCALRVDRR